MCGCPVVINRAALVAFCQARLDEDEWIAQGAARTDDGREGNWLPVQFGAAGFDARVDDHIARHDPARVLRRVKAARLVVITYRVLVEDDLSEFAGVLELAVKAVAAEFADHPEYQPGWAL